MHRTVWAIAITMEKAWKRTVRKQLNGFVDLQRMVMQMHSSILAFVMPMEKVWKRTARKQLNGIKKRLNKVRTALNVILDTAIKTALA